jgi:exopolysaccharide biosynthesis predicted pyruvyltransferase EpsI
MEAIDSTLNSALSNIGNLERCALLNYPNYLNIGDHLIWLGTLIYLTNTLKTDITYIASRHNFSAREMEQKNGHSPILFHGGGNLGDIWSREHNFINKIILDYPDRQIISLPQTIFFKDKAKLEKTANIFNAHENLTIFVRDNYSYEIALNYFNRCKIFKSPDMAFAMLDLPDFKFNRPKNGRILYLYRQDLELDDRFNPNALNIDNLVVEDWVSFTNKWTFGKPQDNFHQFLAKLYREVWQRGILTPMERIHRQKWQDRQAKLNHFEKLDKPSMNLFSLSLAHSAIYQFCQYDKVITNRLHGHILCCILQIPHVFLPNSYYKNKAFHEAWTSHLPFCRFVDDPQQVKNAIQELSYS